MSNIMIDTQVWVYSKKAPQKEKFDSELDFKNALELHKRATNFFRNISKDSIIYFSTQQIGELFHSLAFRGLKLPIGEVKTFINILINSKKVKLIPYSYDDCIKAINLATRSKIHIWDYLCVIPLAKYISKVYTCDAHFKNRTFKELGLVIENPLVIWENL